MSFSPKLSPHDCHVTLTPPLRSREAIQIMGDLAVEYGFYGSMWDSSDSVTYDEVRILEQIATARLLPS